MGKGETTSTSGRARTSAWARVVGLALLFVSAASASHMSYSGEVVAAEDASPGRREGELVVVDAFDAARPSRSRGWILRRALLIADVFAFACAIVIVEATVARFHTSDLALDAILLACVVVWVLLAHGYGLYSSDEIRIGRSTTDDLPGIVLLATLATWVGILFMNATGFAHPRLMVSGTFWAVAVAFLLIGRALARAVVHRRVHVRERTVIVGAGRVGAEIARKLARRPEYALEVVGFVDDDPLIAPDDGPPHLGGTTRIEHILRAYQVERVIFAFSRLPATDQVDLFRRCMDLGVQVDIVPRMFEVIGSRMQVHDLDGLPLVGLRSPRLSRSSRFLKRSLDVVAAATALVLLAPFFAYVAIRIRLGSPGPVFFRQERMGAGGRRFEILKFRTMSLDAEQTKAKLAALNKHTESGPRMFKIPDDPRITPFGQFLRRWSLDELPQLINVVRGEMSLVGPRPLILAEDEHIVGAGRSRLKLTPGLTGLWQVLGRSDIPFAEMITLDYLYVTNWSLWGDVKLLARTVPVVLQRRGAY
jgi:exopolysaccharide biosynthesis polyprenyl glycosylphosphotransferase